MTDHEHEWTIWPETDGLEQKCILCNKFRVTPMEDRFWLKSNIEEQNRIKRLMSGIVAE